MQRAAAFFDLDKTIIAKSSTLAFGRPFFAGGLINRRAVLKASYAQLVYLVAGADEDQMDRMRDYMTALCAGWDVQQVRDIVTETLHDIVDPLIFEEAAALIEEHKANGRAVVIVSSSGEEVVGPIGQMVGADQVIATRMVVKDGRYTGEIDFYAYGVNKASAIVEHARTMGYDLDACYAYSDSATDLPMLEVVGHPTAVNPDRALRKVAVQRGWPVLAFTRAVSLHSRLSGLRQPPRPVVAGTAVGVGAAMVGIAWYAARRRTRRPRTVAMLLAPASARFGTRGSRVRSRGTWSVAGSGRTAATGSRHTFGAARLPITELSGRVPSARRRSGLPKRAGSA